MPLREDLQAGSLRDNDPLNQLRPGGGLYYLNAGYAFGLRAGRITELIKQKLQTGPISLCDMHAIQTDVVLPDAPFCAVHQTGARARHRFAAAAAQVAWHQAPIQAAVARLAAWDFKAPHRHHRGLRRGRQKRPPRHTIEITESVAATLYSVWRAQFIRNTIDLTFESVPLPPGVALPKPGDQLTLTALKRLLEQPQPGVRASGINFFNAPAPQADDRRDIVILKSIADALARLAGVSRGQL